MALPIYAGLGETSLPFDAGPGRTVINLTDAGEDHIAVQRLLAILRLLPEFAKPMPAARFRFEVQSRVAFTKWKAARLTALREPGHDLVDCIGRREVVCPTPPARILSAAKAVLWS